MKAKELLKPRFLVIADYPYSEYPINLILTQELPGVFTFESNGEKRTSNIRDINYPHLFKKLNWWEHRKAEDMPKKLICKAIPNDTEVMEIEEWDMEILFGWTDKSKREGCGLRSFNPEDGYFPVD